MNGALYEREFKLKKMISYDLVGWVEHCELMHVTKKKFKGTFFKYKHVPTFDILIGLRFHIYLD